MLMRRISYKTSSLTARISNLSREVTERLKNMKKKNVDGNGGQYILAILECANEVVKDENITFVDLIEDEPIDDSMKRISVAIKVYSNEKKNSAAFAIFSPQNLSKDHESSETMKNVLEKLGRDSVDSFEFKNDIGLSIIGTKAGVKPKTLLGTKIENLKSLFSNRLKSAAIIIEDFQKAEPHKILIDYLQHKN
ncbi:MAG: hypothetical protein MHPSP_001165 [Paramarteilia canceri]